MGGGGDVLLDALSLFPALLVGVAVLGVFGQEGLIVEAVDYLKSAGAPQETVTP